jgi:type II secretory pathway pseudopilin PulG
MKSFAHPTSATFAKDFSDQTNNPFRLYPDSVVAWRPLREQSAFSLTEVVIAMGVAAVAFTSIIALFPLGLNMSKESYEETQAALLAQTILSDLRDKPSGTNSDYRLIQIGQSNSPTDRIEAMNYIEVDTSKTYLAPITCYVAYNQETRKDTLYEGIELRPFEGTLGKPTWWDTGYPKATTLAMITVSATFRPKSDTVDNPQRVDVCIESPGNLPAASRKQFLFTGAVAP